MAMIQEPVPYTCDPDSILAANPCLQCLSEHELLAVLVAILVSVSPTYSGDMTQAVADSACFTCMSKKQLLQALITKIGYDLLAPGSVPGLIAELKCLICANDQQLRATLIKVLCQDFTIAANLA